MNLNRVSIWNETFIFQSPMQTRIEFEVLLQSDNTIQGE